MKEYVLCKDEKARENLLTKIEAIGVRWYSGVGIFEYKPYTLSIGFNSAGGWGITHDWNGTCGTRVPAWIFLRHLAREFKKNRKNFYE